MVRSSWLSTEAVLTCTVSGSTTSYLKPDGFAAAEGPAFWRSQLNFTAAASSGVPSLKVTPGRSRRIQFLPSFVANDCASSGTTVPSVADWYSNASYTANILVIAAGPPCGDWVS